MKMIFSLYLMLCAVGFIHMLPVSPEYIKQAILDGHNELRRGEGAANMRNLTWDNQLVFSAQALAPLCKAKLRTQNNMNYGYDTHTSDALPSGYVSDILATWTGKRERMDMTESIKVGCAAFICHKFRASGKEYKDVFYLLCMYKPAQKTGCGFGKKCLKRSRC